MFHLFDRFCSQFRWLLLPVAVLLLLPLNTASAVPPMQEEVSCEVEYTVQADDWLSKIADKYLGNADAYLILVEATNQKHEQDDTFAAITDTELIGVGWKLCVPDAETANAIQDNGEAVSDNPQGIAQTDEIVLGVGRDLYYGHGSPEVIHSSLNVWESLIYSDEDLVPQPLLAAGWESNADDTEWTITLREDVLFHDGTPLTAEVAVANLEIDLEEYPIATVDHIEAVDVHTLKVHLSQPTPSLPNLLNNCASAMLSPATWEQEGIDVPVPYGTGPFKFVEYDGEKIVLERNGDYWGEPALTKRIVYRYIPDANTRLLALQSGEIDTIADVGSLMPAQGEIVAADEDLELMEQEVTTTHYLFFNNDKPPFDNQALRQAVSLALDRDQIVSGAVYGYGVPAVSNITPLAANWVNVNAKPAYDLEQARQLATSVLGDQRVSVTLLLHSGLANRWPYGEIAQIIQYSLADLGIDVEIKSVEGGTWNEMLAADDYSFSLRPYTLSSGDPDEFVTYWVGPDGIFNESYSINFSDPAVEDLAVEALVEVNPDTRRSYYDELQMILAEEVPFIPIYHEVTLYATRDNVHGLTLDPNFKPSLSAAYKTAE